MMADIPSVLQGKPINGALKPLQWLIGKWHAENGSGKFPTIEPFSYCEQVEFVSLGQPMLNYVAHSWHPQKQSAMHLESGFLRIDPQTQRVSFLVAHNFGLTTVEEGEVKGNSVVMETKHIARMSFARDPQVTKLVRSWSLREDESLEQIVLMETNKTPQAEHLRVMYRKLK